MVTTVEVIGDRGERQIKILSLLLSLPTGTAEKVFIRRHVDTAQNIQVNAQKEILECSK